MTFKIIPIAEIDQENRQFCFNYQASSRRLTESIRAVGLIHPVIVRSLSSDPRYQIISGFLRLHSCLELDMTQIRAMLFEADELTDRQSLLLSLHQTVGSRNLNLIEISLIVRKLKEIGGLSEGELTNGILPLCHFQPHRKVLHGLERLYELWEGTREYLVRNDVALGNAMLFLEFSMKEQEDLLKLIEPLRLGTNRLKEFLTLIEEIRHREGISVGTIVDDRMRSTLADDNLTIPQKTEVIRGLLKQMRYPRLSEMQREIEEKVKEMRLPPEISCSLPPYLEGDRARFEFSVQSIDELRMVIRKLMEISESPGLDDILNML